MLLNFDNCECERERQQVDQGQLRYTDVFILQRVRWGTQLTTLQPNISQLTNSVKQSTVICMELKGLLPSTQQVTRPHPEAAQSNSLPPTHTYFFLYNLNKVPKIYLPFRFAINLMYTFPTSPIPTAWLYSSLSYVIRLGLV